ncbi:MAG: ABC transporter permease, partial [Oscillospiraceae bacterium]|nr:ABC transporter permease [Oscillospiraceae bacterium]
FSMRDRVMGEAAFETDYRFKTEDHAAAFAQMTNVLEQQGLPTYRLKDRAEGREAVRMMLLVVNVFSYGFIILISLIAGANVFNTISTSIMLRRREFAMLKSIGLGERGFRRMMHYECMIYGAKGLALGLPVSLLITYIIYRVSRTALEQSFYIPWYAVVIAVGSVFLVVFATMLYATSKLRGDNPIDALKNEAI